MYITKGHTGHKDMEFPGSFGTLSRVNYFNPNNFLLSEKLYQRLDDVRPHNPARERIRYNTQALARRNSPDGPGSSSVMRAEPPRIWSGRGSSRSKTMAAVTFSFRRMELVILAYLPLPATHSETAMEGIPHP